MINRAIALAGIYQATELVRHLAFKGEQKPAELETSIGSLFMLDSDSTPQIYSLKEDMSKSHQLDTSDLKMGLQLMTQPMDTDHLRYVIGLLHLERKVSTNPKLKAVLAEGISNVQRQVDYLGITHQNVFAALGDLYSNTVGKMGFRIIVRGQQIHLTNERTVAMIRSLLLAGLRSAVLFRQLGGRRWSLIWSRKKLLSAAQQLLS